MLSIPLVTSSPVVNWMTRVAKNLILLVSDLTQELQIAVITNVYHLVKVINLAWNEHTVLGMLARLVAFSPTCDY